MFRPMMMGLALCAASCGHKVSKFNNDLNLPDVSNAMQDDADPVVDPVKTDSDADTNAEVDAKVERLRDASAALPCA